MKKSRLFLRDIAVWVGKEADLEILGLKLQLVDTNFEINIVHSRQWIEIPKESVPTSTKDFKIIQQPANQLCILNEYLMESKRLLIECTENEDIKFIEIQKM